MNTLKLTFITLSFIAFTSNAEELPKSAFDGAWEYSAQHAPEGYRTGILTVKGAELEVLIGGYQKYTGYEVKVDKNTLSFYTYVEGSRVSVKLTIKDGEVSGIASTQDGAIPLALKRKE